MFKLNKTNKRLAFLLVLVLMIGMLLPTASVFARGDLYALTLDAENFTLIGTNGNKFTIEAKGLDGSWQPTPIDGSKVRWSTNNSSVATISKTSGKTTTVTLHGNGGEAVITASYTDPNVQSVPSNVFVESTTAVDSVGNITVEVKNQSSAVEAITLESVTKGTLSETTKTFKNRPTALHALVQAKINGSPITSYVIDPSGFVVSINGITGASINGVWNGWTYKVNNGPTPSKGAGVYEIHNNDTVTWTYGPLSY